MFLASLALVPRSHGGRLDGQGLQHLLVHISELLYVEAAFAGRVLAELCSSASELLNNSSQSKDASRAKPCPIQSEPILIY